MNTTQAPTPNPKSVARKLDAIKALRHEHTRLFMAFQFQSMQTVSDKIKLAWEDYEFAKRCAFEKRVCFNCCTRPHEEFTVDAPGKLSMLFCSAECRMEFGISLGLT